tara:strand:+ start:112 stop:372 length:261 start_codon:yes stop_codon:yes gene_type:complete
MEPYVISKGYDKFSGKKLVERYYRIRDLISLEDIKEEMKEDIKEEIKHELTDENSKEELNNLCVISEESEDNENENNELKHTNITN